MDSATLLHGGRRHVPVGDAGSAVGPLHDPRAIWDLQRPLGNFDRERLGPAELHGAEPQKRAQREAYRVIADVEVESRIVVSFRHLDEREPAWRLGARGARGSLALFQD